MSWLTPKSGVVLLLLAGGLAACSDDDSGGVTPVADVGSDTGVPGLDAGIEDVPDVGSAPTTLYYRDVKPIIDGRCVACHQAGAIGPFELTEAEEVARFAPAVANQVMIGKMPPWPPDNQCQTYRHDRSLTDAQREVIQTWASEGAPLGDPGDFPGALPGDIGGLSRVDLRLQTPEPYTPEGRDDYHCFVIEWPEAETNFVTGFGLEPGNSSLVHHVNMYIASPTAAETYRTRQNEAEGPGFPCFGGIFGTGISLMGAWAPGSLGLEFTEGTGVQVSPGSALVLEVHYNTGPGRMGSDQSTVLVQTSTSVERRAAILPITGLNWPDGNMLIPAGEAEVSHSVTFQGLLARQAVAFLAPWLSGQPLEIHATGLHMHYLGRNGRIHVTRTGGEEVCVIDIPDWDFDWQSGYLLEQSIRFDPASDGLTLNCMFDNTAENQPVIDGVQREPADVNWGNNSDDEMCIGYLYVTALDE